MSENTQKVIERFKKQVKIDRSNLSEDIARNPSYLFSVGLKKAEAERLRDKAKINVKVVRAKTREKLERLKVDGKKLTIPQIESRVDASKEVIEAETQLYNAQYVLNFAFSAYESMKDKGNQLSNLAYNYRKEMEHGYVGNESRKHKEDRVKDKVNKNRDSIAVKKKKG